MRRREQRYYGSQKELTTRFGIGRATGGVDRLWLL